ncbi:unnamed protein product [Nezara viridula]|uniref:Uncharacterized protein n=1 Tax=Nezara viridula TaxID=85310 RepID=A0A9P0HQ55_NEZVI|nr:unnamed protein product [Nezara viridula]
MSYQPVIKDSDIIDGLSVKYLKFYGLWKVINDYRTTGEKNAMIRLHIWGTIFLVVHQCCFGSQPDMSYQSVIRDSDIIDGLSVRYIKLYGLWKVINDYRATGKMNRIIKFQVFGHLSLFSRALLVN